MEVNGITLGTRTCEYNFARVGGAISTINMGVFLPRNSVVTSSFYEVLTTHTSAGAGTFSIGSATAGNVVYHNVMAVAALTIGSVLVGAVNTANVVIPLGEQLTITLAAFAFTAGVGRFTAIFAESPAG